MGIESMPISSQENPERIGETLRNKIYNLQLVYVDRLMKDQTPLPEMFEKHGERPMLGQLLASFTNLNRELAVEYSKRTGKEADPASQEYLRF